MKLVIIGATRGTGQQVMRQALEAGHTVTAIVRRPEDINLRHEKLNIVRGDVMQPESLRNAFAGQDAVISSLGIDKNEPTTLFSAGIANVLQAMQAENVRRLMVISANGLEPGPLWQRLIAKPLLWYFLKHSYADLVRMENIIKQSDRDWTIMRPPRLTDGDYTGQIQWAINKHLTKGWYISRADLAAYMLGHLTDSSTYCGWIDVAHL